MARRAKKDFSWEIAKTDSNVVVLRHHIGGLAQRQGRMLLLADIHWDSAHCERALLKKTLDEAKETNTPVFIFGDLFDAMQGKWDPRSSQDVLRPEHRGGNYLDLLVNTAIEWFTPYKDVIALVTYGNHETSILKRHEVDLIQRFVGGLRQMTSPALVGPYWGFVVLAASCSYAHRDKADVVKKIAWHHGYGGGGEITRGLIDHSRTRSQYDADVYVSGHIHRRNCDENVVTRVTSRGLQYTSQQLFLRCSSWKQENDGYHVEKGRAARPVGGWWLNYADNRTLSVERYDLTFKPVAT